MADDVTNIVELCGRQYRDYVDNTIDHRNAAEIRRDYYDGKQWTSEAAQVLKDRKQAPIVKNRIAPKVDFLIGLEQQSRTDPKAYPRTPKHEQGAEAATDALRYLEEVSGLDAELSEGFGEHCIEGIEAYIVPIERKRGSVMPTVQRIPWDRFYYDPRSRRNDFADARFLGLTVWMQRSVVKKMFKKKADDIDALRSSPFVSAWEANADRPTVWLDREGDRIRVNQHWFIDEETEEWAVLYFSGDMELIPVTPSPYKDEDGNRTCPIIAQSTFIDRENNRYGPVARLIDIQDEINHRSSKALHFLSSARMWAAKGVIPDPEAALDELQKGRGFIEAAGVQGQDWGIIGNSELAIGQVQMLQEAKAEIDAIGANAALTGKDERALSGRALQQRSASGQTELGLLFDSHRQVKLRIYRALWMRVRQFWTEETWVRVTDDERNIRFVGLNKPVTHAEKLQQAGIAVTNPNSPDMQTVVEKQNDVEKMDVDIIIEDAPDTVTIQQEQFEVIAQLAQAQPQNPGLFELVIELSTLRNKQQVLEKLKGGNDPQQQAAMQAQAQMVQDAQQAKVQRDKAAALKDVSTAAKNFSEGAQGHGAAMAQAMGMMQPDQTQQPEQMGAPMPA